MSGGEKNVPTADDAERHSTAEPGKAVRNSLMDGSASSWEEDAALMNLVAAGDREAMGTVARRLSPRVRRLSRMLVRNDSLAEDAAQVSLVEILGSARNFGGRSSLERWADRITARVTLRAARSERRRGLVVASMEDLDVPEPSIPAQASSQEAREETPRPMVEYLDQLPVAQREALVMKHSLGFTVEEIAAELAVPVGTVKDRLVTARRQLRKLIQRELAVGKRKERSS